MGYKSLIFQDKVNERVGIGTTSPGAYKLNISGTGYFAGQIEIVKASIPLVSLQDTTNSSIWNLENGRVVGSFSLYKSGIGTVWEIDGSGSSIQSGSATINGNINLNTNGTSVLMSSYKGANSDGFNVFIGGGGQSSIGAVGTTYKGSNNTASGYLSLYSNTTGHYNTASGYASLYSNTTGYRNTASGYASLYSNTTGYYNTANGYLSLYSNTGYQNTANGMYALLSNTTGYNNTAHGMQAGRYIADGLTANQTSNNSLYLGYNSKALASGDTNEIVIGASAVGVGSNSVVLGNDSITKTVLKGNVGIGTTSPGAKLDVNGGIKMANDTATASSANIGTIRYRSDANNSYTDMCMQTGAVSYAWVNIKTNTW